MSEAIAILFNGEDEAREAMANLRAIEQDDRIAFSDTALVARDADGTLHVRNELDSSTETGMTIGTVIGALFGPLGLVAGFLGGAAVGASQDTGVDRDQVEEMERQIQPGTSALFLAIKEAQADALVGALGPFEGRVIRSTLTPEAEEVLNMAMGPKPIELDSAATEPADMTTTTTTTTTTVPSGNADELF